MAKIVQDPRLSFDMTSVVKKVFLTQKRLREITHESAHVLALDYFQALAQIFELQYFIQVDLKGQQF